MCRELSIEPLALSQQALQITLRPDQGTLGGRADALLQQIEGDVQEHAGPGVPQRDPVRRLQDHAAAAGDHRGVMARHLDERPGLKGPEGGLPFAREDLRDGRAVASLDLAIEVDERDTQTTRDLASDR
jgi:hypothetical protein